jgi:hypothetical protein
VAPFKVPLSLSVFAALKLKPVTSPGDLLSPELSMYRKKPFAMSIVLNPPWLHGEISYGIMVSSQLLHWQSMITLFLHKR